MACIVVLETISAKVTIISSSSQHNIVSKPEKSNCGNGLSITFNVEEFSQFPSLYTTV